MTANRRDEANENRTTVTSSRTREARGRPGTGSREDQKKELDEVYQYLNHRNSSRNEGDAGHSHSARLIRPRRVCSRPGAAAHQLLYDRACYGGSQEVWRSLPQPLRRSRTPQGCRLVQSGAAGPPELHGDQRLIHCHDSAWRAQVSHRMQPRCTLLLRRLHALPEGVRGHIPRCPDRSIQERGYHQVGWLSHKLGLHLLPWWKLAWVVLSESS